MAYYALTHADGSVEIMQTIPRRNGSVPTLMECLAKWHPSRRAEIVSVVPVDPASIPADRTYRAALAVIAGRLGVDMAKARAVHRDRIRDARRAKFTELDDEAAILVRRIALTGGTQAQRDRLQALEQRAQALRDAPQDPAIDAATTLEALKTVWPAILD
jgi:hypothetical protein